MIPPEHPGQFDAEHPGGHGDHIAYPKTYEGLHSKIVVEMGKATAIYVRDSDLELWEQAERYAREHRMPMSGLVLLALERFLAEQDPGQHQPDR